MVRRLVALEETGRLGVEQVELAAGGLGVSSRTVWRWVRQARAGEGLGRRPRGRFLVTDEIRQRLAFWRGNVAALHRELVEAAEVRRSAGAEPVDAAARCGAGSSAPVTGRVCAGGERARRAYDVFLQRPRTHRNAVWEADHVEAPVEVDVEGRLVKPWVTWFVDAATNVVCGTAVTPGPASRESILAALRAAITLEAPYGPPGACPERVRIDRGKDFLSRTVAAVLAGFAVKVGHLPPYTPHLKGTVETVNGAAGADVLRGSAPVHERPDAGQRPPGRIRTHRR